MGDADRAAAMGRAVLAHAGRPHPNPSCSALHELAHAHTEALWVMTERQSREERCAMRRSSMWWGS